MKTLTTTKTSRRDEYESKTVEDMDEMIIGATKELNVRHKLLTSLKSKYTSLGKHPSQVQTKEIMEAKKE